MIEDRITSLGSTELEQMIMLAQMIMCDHRPAERGPFGIGFVFAQTTDNADSCFRRADQMARCGMISSLGISDGNLGHGYDGFDASVARLQALGWDNRVPIIKFDVGGNVNTRSEARVFAQYAKNQVEDVCVIAPPFHIVRAFITMVTQATKYAHPPRVYAVPGTSLPWQEEALHSQGTVYDTRVGLLGNELGRLEKYRGEDFGSLLSAKKMLDYLRWRDEA